MFNFDRRQLRQTYVTAWQKYQTKQILTPLEQQLVDIILLHPEYQALFTSSTANGNLDEDFTSADAPENPFLHLSLHMAIQEQIRTDRPVGIKTVYAKLCAKYRDPHQAQHAMMQCLANMLWQAQQTQQLADEQEYWDHLQRLL